MLTPTVVTPVTLTPNAIRYPLIQIVNRLNAAGVPKTSASIQLQRAQKTEAGVWIDDPSIGAQKTKQIIDLEVYCTTNPTIGALIVAAWNAIDAVVAAINDVEHLV